MGGGGKGGAFPGKRSFLTRLRDPFPYRNPDWYRSPPHFDPDHVPWYNSMSPEARWEKCLSRAKINCSRLPKGPVCQTYIQLLVDCPKEKLEGYELPPLINPAEPLNPPLKLRDPCKFWKRWRDTCRKCNTHFNAQWWCVPFEAFVEDHCPSDRRD